MGSQAEPGIQGDGDCRRADGDVSGRHADDIDEQGHGEDRAAPADEAEDKPDDPTRPDGQDEGEGSNGHDGLLAWFRHAAAAD